MELWIRSQNKDRIVKANAVMVITFQELVAIHCYMDKEKSVWLGNYETKERALKVLNEIQESQLGNFHYKCPSNVKVSSKEDTIVYEMPQE